MKKELTGKKNSTPTVEGKIRVERISDFMLSGAKKSIVEGVKNYVPMNMHQACKQEGMTEQNFLYYMKSYPSLKEKYEAVREAKRGLVGNIAENNLAKALGGEEDIDAIDKARLSLDFLKATEKTYNPKIEVEQTNKNLNFNISDEELIARINDLMMRLGK